MLRPSPRYRLTPSTKLIMFSSFKNTSGPFIFPAVDQLLQTLRNLQNIRIQQDDEIAHKIKAELDAIQAEKAHQFSELNIDQSIRRGEETVRVWSQNGARAMRDAALANLINLEIEERKHLYQEFQRLFSKAETKSEAYTEKIEREREAEDEKHRQTVARFTGGKHSPQNLLGLIVVVEKLQATTLAFERQMLSTASPASPNVSFSDIATVPSAMMSFGIPTPNNTPPSSSEPRFGTLQEPPPTPTPAPRKNSAVIGSRFFTSHHSGRECSPSFRSSATKTQVLRSSKPLTPVSRSRSGEKAKKSIVVIDLVSDTDDDLLAPKCRQIGSLAINVDDTPAQQSASASASLPKIKVPVSKRVAKKPITRPVVRRLTAPKKVETTIQSSINVLALAVDDIAKKLVTIAEPGSARADSPGIFDSDSDYSETESRKRRRNGSLEVSRIRSGKLLMGELLDAPGSTLSPAKGILWKNWVRRVYSPQKIIKFTVKFIWTHKESGEISKFNDDTNPLGFYFLRRAHTYVPVIGHAKKETVHPEFVLEEGEMEHVQYNSEFALACITKNTGVQSDVLVKFGSRAELWDFLVVTNMEMNIHVFENLNLKLPAWWLF
ncbi:hypothetical protein BKA65DRAFT_586939 [Rhexocercosporidium sp. MPI-PUGE-AT-0058]|nr:hypothetical protein BKA65DRAFT_586939 [Rhexocercosporidium sp. MPI-PUGE-AT-0058]